MQLRLPMSAQLPGFAALIRTCIILLYSSLDTLLPEVHTPHKDNTNPAVISRASDFVPIPTATCARPRPVWLPHASMDVTLTLSHIGQGMVPQPRVPRRYTGALRVAIEVESVVAATVGRRVSRAVVVAGAGSVPIVVDPGGAAPALVAKTDGSRTAGTGQGKGSAAPVHILSVACSSWPRIAAEACVHALRRRRG